MTALEAEPTGADGTDAKHASMLAEIDQLRMPTKLSGSGNGAESLLKLAEHHFAREESEMRALAYPELQRHLSDHVRLLDDFADLADKARIDGNSFDVVEIARIREAMLHHFKTDDALFLDYKRTAPGLWSANRGGCAD